MLGGGFPTGRLTELCGEPGVGKTQFWYFNFFVIKCIYFWILEQFSFYLFLVILFIKQKCFVNSVIYFYVKGFCCI